MREATSRPVRRRPARPDVWLKPSGVRLNETPDRLRGGPAAPGGADRDAAGAPAVTAWDPIADGRRIGKHLMRKVPAIHTVPDVSSPTYLSVIVPATAAGGPIRVMTFAATGGTVFSTTSFLGQPCHGDPGVHSRTVTLRLRRHLVARGTVGADDGFAGWVAGITVKIQRRADGRWRTVASTATDDAGAFSQRIRDVAGRYRAKAPRLSVDDADVCLADESPVVRHATRPL